MSFRWWPTGLDHAVDEPDKCEEHTDREAIIIFAEDADPCPRERGACIECVRQEVSRLKDDITELNKILGAECRKKR